jgi:hypothetical protein
MITKCLLKVFSSGRSDQVAYRAFRLLSRLAFDLSSQNMRGQRAGRTSKAAGNVTIGAKSCDPGGPRKPHCQECILAVNCYQQMNNSCWVAQCSGVYWKRLLYFLRSWISTRHVPQRALFEKIVI